MLFQSYVLVLQQKVYHKNQQLQGVLCQGGADPSPARHKVMEWFCLVSKFYVGIRHGAALREYMIHIDTC